MAIAEIGHCGATDKSLSDISTRSLICDLSIYSTQIIQC